MRHSSSNWIVGVKLFTSYFVTMCSDLESGCHHLLLDNHYQQHTVGSRVLISRGGAECDEDKLNAD